MALNWNLTPADNLSTMDWSYGLVKTLADLYDERIFGPMKDLECKCKKCVGEEYEGRMCDSCYVVVTGASQSARRTRMGHICLASPCQHPWGPDGPLVDVFPICPVDYRFREGLPTPLGQDYELLVKINESLKASLPERLDSEYWPTVLIRKPARELQPVLDRIARGEGTALGEDCLLMREFLGALVRNPAEASTLLRSMGWGLSLHGSV